MLAVSMELNNNNMENYKYLYLVEGKTDIDKLKKIGVAYTLDVGGKFIKSEILDFLIEASKRRRTIILMDPDTPGKEISNKLKLLIKEPIVLRIDKSNSIKRNKVGIAETETNYLNSFLNQYIEHDKLIFEEQLTVSDLYGIQNLKPNSLNFKNLMKSHFKIPYDSLKRIVYCLNIMRVTKEDLHTIYESNG